MKVTVNQDACISCALCVDQCPEIFEFNGDNKSEAKVENVDSMHIDRVKNAAYECPTEAIKLQ